MFGGDDVNALVFDIGSLYTKIGYGGEENPSYCFPTDVGVVEDSMQKQDQPGKEIQMDVDGQVAAEKRKVKYVLGTNNLCVRRDGMEVKNPYGKGEVNDVDLLEELWRYALYDRMRVDPREHPILYSDPPISELKTRQKMTEVFFEVFESPAFYLANEAMLSAFANGRSAALVLKCGHQTTSVVPVHDGYVLKNMMMRTAIGGEYLTAVFKEILRDKDIDIVPQYGFKRRQIRDNEFILTYRSFPQTHPTYKAYMQMKIVSEIKESLCRVGDRPLNINLTNKLPTVSYELPDGRRFDAGHERLSIPELLFNPSVANVINSKTPGSVGAGPLASAGVKAAGTAISEAPSSLPKPMSRLKIVELPKEFIGLPRMVHGSISSCDADIRKELYGSVIISGGGTLFTGFAERLHKELMQLAPQQAKIKMIAASTTSERKFTPWIGGSILSSLGTFHQLWISKQDYEEYGVDSVLRHKCPI